MTDMVANAHLRSLMIIPMSLKVIDLIQDGVLDIKDTIHVDFLGRYTTTVIVPSILSTIVSAFPGILSSYHLVQS